MAFMAILSCEQPFKAGLGPVVDTRPPTVQLDSPKAADYIWGVKRFTGTAEDDYKLDKVQIKVTNYPDIPHLRDYTKVTLTKNNKGKNTHSWYIDIDTTKFPDGDLKIQLMAVDSMGKTAETDEIAFFIKNTPPAITVAAPLILRSEDADNGKEGEVGGPRLNFGTVDSLSPGINYIRKMDKGTFLSGTISHDQDIYRGPADPDKNLYPPQIRFWMVGEGTGESAGYPAGYLPTTEQVPWESFAGSEAGALYELNLGNYQFTYDLPLETNHYYGFEIRAQNKDGRSHFHYPRDFYGPDVDWDSTSAGDFEKENRYVLIYLRSPRNLPDAELYNFQDILGPNGWNDADGGYYNDLPGELNDNSPHPYVNSMAVKKSGAFTLRLKTSHQEGISSAEIYWERGNDRGRFIWDDAQKEPYPGWSDANSVPANLPYSYWGYRDPHSRTGTFYTTRSFIFTYDSKSNNRIPNDSAYNEQVRGRSKLQRYKGPNDDTWKSGKAGATWPSLPPSAANEMWEDINGPLPDGIYNIEVYVRSLYGTPMSTPKSYSVHLDTKAPVIELTRMDGVFSEEGPTAFTVNGVVQPYFLFLEERPEDSLVRIATEDYFDDYDRFYVLVDETSGPAMQALIADGTWWPITPLTKPGDLTTGGISANGSVIKVYADGPITGGTLKVKTSGVYNTWSGNAVNQDPAETDKLDDGSYQLYVFCRDNAFNVGNNWFTLDVQEETDRPQFDFSVGQVSEKVTDPNISSDYSANGFIIDANTRQNVLGQNTNIRIRITDDDALDLDELKITFTGSYTDGSGSIQPYTGTGYEMEVTEYQLQTRTSPAKEATITIRQTDLLEMLLPPSLGGINPNYAHLFETGKEYRSLPDGIYRIHIEIKDDVNAKLILGTDPNPAEVAANSVSFWIAVDSVSPEINIPPATDTPSGFLSGNATITGQVSDRNGPITVKSFRVENEFGTEIHNSDGSLTDPNVTLLAFTFLDSVSLSPEVWLVGFTARLNLTPGVSGTYVLVLELQDRFGRSSVITRSYQVDNEPPAVDLREKIPTFERNYGDVNLTTPTGTDFDGVTNNKLRLTNGVIYFTINATDNFKVNTVRWWLLPESPGLNFSLPDKYTPAQMATSDFDNYQPTGTLTGIGRNGKLNSGFQSTRIFIDTAALTDNKEYHLYVAAMDTAGNVCREATGFPFILQKIYVLQDQDKPYFSADITPNNTTEGASTAILRGTIEEDDGFRAGDGTGIMAGAVRVRMSTTSGDLGTATWVPIPETNGSTRNYRRQGNNLILSINLIDYFSTSYSSNIFASDGQKYYQIEVTDSWYGKYVVTTGTQGEPDTSTRVSSQSPLLINPYSFMYDTKDPEIKITLPASGDSAGAAFAVSGTIMDANLAQKKDLDSALSNPDFYYVRYWLDSDIQNIKTFEITNNTAGGHIHDDTPNAGETTVDFTIPAATLWGADSYDFGDLDQGPHTLFLTVKDKSGKEGSASLLFIKDNTPPTFTFTNIEEEELSTVPDGTAGWYTTNWNYLKDKKLTVIQYGEDVPFIQGTFDDDVSDIDTNSFYFAFDDGSMIGPLAAFGAGSGKNVSWKVYITDTGLEGGTILADGIHTFEFTIKDSVGNQLYADPSRPKFGFRLNSALPTVDVSVPVAVFGNKGSLPTDTVLSVTGSAKSANIKGVEVSIRYTDKAGSPTITGTVSEGTWTFAGASPVIETIPWTLNITRGMLYQAAVDSSKLTPGSYELIAKSSDLYGNESNEFVWSFIIDPASPEFDFNLNTTANTTDRLPESWRTDNARNVIRDAQPRIQGRVSDALSNLTAVEYQIRKYNYVGRNWQYYNFGTPGWNGAPTDWANVVPPLAASPEYSLNLDLKALLTAPLLTDGYYCIQLRAKDSSTIGGGAGWTNADDGNPAVSNYVYFFYAADDITLNNAGSTDQYFSSKKNAPGYNLPFTVAAASLNSFDRLEVAVSPTGGTVGSSPVVGTPPVNTGFNNTTWNPSVNITFNPAACKDGTYNIIFTVYDLAGSYKSVSRTIILDNKDPAGRIDDPRFIAAIANHPGSPYQYASETIYGGDDYTIKGITDDTGDNGSASGVKSLWYHLGYLGTGTDSNLTFPTEAQISDSYATATAANAWFEYAANKDVPHGFTSMPTNPADVNLRNWELEIKHIANTSDIKDYTGPLSMYGTSYNPSSGTGRWLVQKIDESKIPLAYQKSGLYSMPLWIRVEDNVGNVFFTCRDLWIYPHGDNPSAVITNPSASTVKPTDNPRGGAISIEGVASDNKSVRSVIYRVFADSTHGTEAQALAPPVIASLVTLGKPALPSLTSVTAPYEYAVFTNSDYNTNLGSGGFNGWYRATMEDLEGPPNVGWSFMINAEDEIKDLIPLRGFSQSGSGPYDTIRVYVEIFVLDGDPTAPPANPPAYAANNLLSLGDSTNLNAPKPYVRAFYLKNTAPKIDTKEISNHGSTTSFGPYPGYYDSDNKRPFVRRGQFAFRAHLDSGDTNTSINQISVRMQDGLSWQDAYVGGTNRNLPGITLNSTDNYRNCTITYQFDSLLTAKPGAGAASDWVKVGSDTFEKTGGKFTVDVRIRDNNSPPGEDTYTFELGVDNFAPLADTEKLITPKKAAGTNVSFIGRVFDYFNSPNTPRPDYKSTMEGYRSIDKVYAWFTKDENHTQYLSMKDGSPLVGAPATMNAYVGRSAEVKYTDDSKPDAIEQIGSGAVYPAGITEGTSQSISYPNPLTAADYVKELSDATGGIMANRVTWQPTGAHDILWSFITDTTVLPDGWIYLNYLVIDSVGNASFYQQKTVIMNKNPWINTVTLLTDNKGEGAAFSTHDGDEAKTTYPIGIYSSGYLNSGFISKNTVIGFGISTVSGNAPLNYRLEYVNREAIPLTAANLAKMANERWGDPGGFGDAAAGNVYTIKTTKGVDSYTWAALGVVHGDIEAGANFVFTAKLADIVGMNYLNAEVWRYTRVDPNLIRGIYNQGDDIPPTDLLFSDNAADTPPSGVTGPFFGTGRILQKRGSQPGEPLKPASPVQGTVYDDPADTAYFLIKVWDTVNGTSYGQPGHDEYDMLYDAVVIGMNVFLSDYTPPIARLYDLNPYTELAVTDNNVTAANLAATIRNAADPQNQEIEQNILRGGLFNTGTEDNPVRSGYIDPRTDTTAMRPWFKNPRWQRTVTADNYQNNDAGGAGINDKVSGKVILRGLAWDDQLIDEIRIKIGGDAAIPILKLTPPITTPLTAGQSRSMQPVGTTQAYASEKMHWQTGHTVEWAYVWDTEIRPATGRATALPVNGVAIQVEVVDIHGQMISGGGQPSGAKGLSSTQTLNAAGTDTTTQGYLVFNPVESSGYSGTPLPDDDTKFHNTVTVDIVPYIIGFERKTPDFTTKRSLQGWYSFYQGEAGISVRGYNLGINKNTAGNASSGITVNIGGTNTAAPTYVHDAASPDRRRYTFTVPAAAASGAINVAVNGTGGTGVALNQDYNRGVTVPVTARSWNREYNPSTPGSDLWVNKPYVHIWRSDPVTSTGNPTLSFTGSGGLDSPGMSLQYNTGGGGAGTLHGAWSTYGLAGFYYGTAGGSTGSPARTLLGRYAEPFSHTDIDYWNGAAFANNNASVVAASQDDGAATLRIKTQVSAGNDATGTLGPPVATYPTLGDAVNPSATDRWQNARIRKNAVSGSATNAGSAFISAYDAVYARLFYTRYVGARDGQYFLDGGGTAGTGVGANIANTNTWGNVGTTARGNSTSTRAGKYSAIDYDTNGYPVIAYYDETNDTLRLAYADRNNPNPGTNDQWTRRYVISENHALRRGSGAYVSMRIDGNNNIHLAFFNSNKNIVVYAVGTKTTAFTVYAIDSVVQGGAWTDISVDSNGNPYIVYADSTRTGERDGVRIAYRGQFNGRALNDPFVPGQLITGWEALTMPAPFTVNNDRLNIESWPPINRGGAVVARNTGAAYAWDAAVGYASDLFRLAYFYKPAAMPTGF
ncbi:MAG: hypothetical protein LBH20_07575 [Treponema sp.]|jgi:hypothetical protein|nr:hypothetical protein [Treponema sp.]